MGVVGSAGSSEEVRVEVKRWAPAPAGGGVDEDAGEGADVVGGAGALVGGEVGVGFAGGDYGEAGVGEERAEAGGEGEGDVLLGEVVGEAAPLSVPPWAGSRTTTLRLSGGGWGIGLERIDCGRVGCGLRSGAEGVGSGARVSDWRGQSGRGLRMVGLIMVPGRFA